MKNLVDLLFKKERKAFATPASGNVKGPQGSFTDPVDNPDGSVTVTIHGFDKDGVALEARRMKIYSPLPISRQVGR